MKENIATRLDAFRKLMKANGVYAMIIPHVDPHQSENIASHWQVRRYLSGFTGSAGNLVITPDEALLWTDSRYFIQAADQLSGTPFKLMKEGLVETPTINEYLLATVPAGETVGIDGMLVTKAAAEDLAYTLDSRGIKLNTSVDIIDEIWTDRPALPQDKVFIHEIKYAGKSACDKIADILAVAAKDGAQDVLLVALDEIAWTLNIRSTDVPCNPVATSFLYLSPKGSVLFIDSNKLTPEVETHLAEANVASMAYDAIIPYLEKITDKVLYNPARTPKRLVDAIPEKFRVIGDSPLALAKACKNEIQIAGERDALRRDGAALVGAFMEIEETLAAGRTLTEIDVDKILYKHRSAQPLYFGTSFDTIAGYGPHGAIVHYSASPETNATIEPHGLLLIDSGAQYLDGTTDITRTIALSKPTQMQKSDFTMVMKGHIALATAIFPAGTRGAQLDVLARQFLWKAGLTYLHGTGHGIGHFLNCHEGPQSIRLNDVPATLRPGMITSNEPGVYREGIHGIRCENLILTVPAFETEFGKFYRFETITYFPFDRNLFEISMMTADEIKWVNDYHETVYRELSPLLNETRRQWLRDKTMPL